MKSTETRDALINQAFCFMRALIDEFGPEAGAEMWDTISATLPKGVRTQLLMTMLTGSAGDRITIRDTKMSAQKVPLIKALREYDSRGLGLKEAKEMVDELTGTGWSTGRPRKAIEVHIKPNDRSYIINRLSDAGFVV